MSRRESFALVTLCSALLAAPAVAQAQPGDPAPPSETAPQAPAAPPADADATPAVEAAPDAQEPAPTDEPEPPAASTTAPPTSSPPLVTTIAPSPLSRLQMHGFVSQGGFVSTANDYIGESSRGSLAFFEAGLNVSTEVADRLRAGIQLFGRNVGEFRDLPPRVDWAFLDYRWHTFLGLRAGIIKMPLGLHNEYADIDAARTPILLPQSVYPLRNRSALLAQTGFAVYGTTTLQEGGSFDYQVWFGRLDVPENALEVVGATLDGIDSRYVTGTQLLWRTPVDGLRVGGTFLRASIDFALTLDPATVAALIMAGLVPPEYDGSLVISQKPEQMWVASAEYLLDDWLFAAEYGRSYKRQKTTLPALLPTFEERDERFYAMVARRISRLELAAYYSVFHADKDDRRGRDRMKFPERFYAWQRDASLTLRFDVNEHWLWKAEAHFIDGTADLMMSDNPSPERFWGLFLFRTTVTF